MEREKYFTIRVSNRIKKVYKEISYTKSKLLEKFRKKYGRNYNIYLSYFMEVKKVPPSLVGGKFTIISPVNAKSKKEFEAFAGYIVYALKKHRGNVKKTIEWIRRDLEV